MKIVFDVLVRVGALVLLLAVILAIGVFSVDQTMNILERNQVAQERVVQAACVEYGIPHGMIVDGTAYCYAIVDGSERMIELEELRLRFPNPASATT